VKLEIFLEIFFVTSTAASATNTVEPGVKTRKRESFEKSHYHFYQFYIYPGTGLSYCLHPYLVKLSKPSSLGSLIPEHRAQIMYPPQVFLPIQFVLNIGSYDGCGSLRTKGQTPSFLILEGVHVLSRICLPANTAKKKIRLFKGGGSDFFITIAREKKRSLPFHPLVEGGPSGKDIFDSTR